MCSNHHVGKCTHKVESGTPEIWGSHKCREIHRVGELPEYDAGAMYLVVLIYLEDEPGRVMGLVTAALDIQLC